MITSVLLGLAALAPRPQALEPPNLAPPPVWVEGQTLVMGTRLRSRVLAGGRAEGLDLLDEIHETLREMEGVLSTWREDSELARFNRAPVGRSVPISGELLSLLVEVAEWSRVTNGAFDPAVGSLVRTWDLRGEGRRPSSQELRRALEASGLDGLSLESGRGVGVRLREDVHLDAGGFGKGAALREARRILRAHGARAILDFGGQILAVGGAADSWEVRVAHPSRRHEPAAVLRVSDASVATSGASERHVRVGGRTLGHVVDPRTGIPVKPWGSVTVVAEDPLAADLLATAFFVMGPEPTLRWARKHGEYKVLVLVDGAGPLEARWTRALEPHLIWAPMAPAEEADPGGVDDRPSWLRERTPETTSAERGRDR